MWRPEQGDWEEFGGPKNLFQNTECAGMIIPAMRIVLLNESNHCRSHDHAGHTNCEHLDNESMPVGFSKVFLRS